LYSYFKIKIRKGERLLRRRGVAAQGEGVATLGLILLFINKKEWVAAQAKEVVVSIRKIQ
jgi:hypothetical protein